MYDAQLDLCFREGRTDGIRETLEAIDTGYQDVLQPPVLKIGQYLEPEIGTFTF